METYLSGTCVGKWYPHNSCHLKICLKNKIKFPKNIIIFKPVSYLESLLLIKNSDFVVTDSGGVQKETYLLKKKCFILRDRTEWSELLSFNSYLIDVNVNKILKYIKLEKKNVQQKYSAPLQPLIRLQC